MNTPNEGFELSSATLRGATVSVEYHNSQAILRSEQTNPEVAFEIYAEEPGVVSGIEEVMSVLRTRLPSASSSVESLSDGDSVQSDETIMRIVSSYAAFGLYLDTVLGIIASNSGWASAAKKCVDAADTSRVMVAAASDIHPEVVGSLEYSSYKAGCVAVSTQISGELTSTLPQGSMSGEFILIWGSVERAMTLYDRHVRIGIQRIMPVPTVSDAIQESLDTAYMLSGPQSNPLRAVRLDIPSNLGGGSAGYVIELKHRLSNAGFGSVDIHVGGDLTPDSIAQYMAAEAPVSLFVVGRYIASAPPLKISAGIKEVDGNPVAPRGMAPGRRHNPRMTQHDIG